MTDMSSSVADPFAHNAAIRKAVDDVTVSCLDRRMLIALQEDIPIAHLMHASTIVQKFTRSFVLKKCRKGGATGPEMFMFWMYHARRFVTCRMALRKGLKEFVRRRRQYIEDLVTAWEDCDDRARRMPGEVTFLEFVACNVPREKKRTIVVDFRRLAVKQFRNDWRKHAKDMEQHYENFFYIVTDTFEKVSTGCFQILRQFLLDVLFPSKHRPKLWKNEVRVVDLLRTAATLETSVLGGGDPDASLVFYFRERIVEGENHNLIQSIITGPCCQMRLFPSAPLSGRSKFPWFASVRSKEAIVESATKRKEHAFEQKIPPNMMSQPHYRSPRQQCIAELLNLVHDDWYKHRLFQGIVHVQVDTVPKPTPRKTIPTKPKDKSPPREAAHRERPEHVRRKAPVPRFKRSAAAQTNSCLSGVAPASAASSSRAPPTPLPSLHSDHLLVTRIADENFVAPVRLVLRPQLPSPSHGRYCGSVSDPFPLMKRLMSAGKASVQCDM